MKPSALCVALQTALLLVVLIPCAAQSKSRLRNHVVIDARATVAPAQPLPFAIDGQSSSGPTLSANRRYLLLDGKPWFPVMGEFHYSRYPEDGWEEEILKMKAAGIQVISSYVFWIHHEEIEGQFDWTGQRNLRRFVELCAKHGLYVWIRIGPWDHGEVRNGGLPDWILEKTATRQNDPAYLQYVARFFNAIGGQLQGLFWRDGGPIIGVQLENEYNLRGPGRGEEHILRLLQLARDARLVAPFYTVTGWDGAVIPERDILPVFSGYADGFWWRSTKDLPPRANFFFTNIRCEENVADDLTSKHPEIDTLDSGYPFLTAEMGGGMELSYHRRPRLTAEDSAAMELVKLGSGVTMYGLYMFHGGTNPAGRKTDLEESQATGYLNDLPVKSYDFQAPLGEFGEENPSFRVLKLLHLFLGDFGSELAPMTPFFPDRLPQTRQDVATPRVAARLQGGRGFLFINNYQRTTPLPKRPEFQVELKLADSTLRIPEHPLTIPAGAYMIWPVNLPLGAGLLRYATAQLLCKLEDPSTYVFFTWPGVPAEFAFEEKSGETIESQRGRVRKERGIVYIDQIEPGMQVALRVKNYKGEETSILVLAREQALDLWKLNLAGKQRLIFSRAQLYGDGNRLTLAGSEPEFRIGIFPAPTAAVSGFSENGEAGVFHLYTTSLEPLALSVRVEKLNSPGADPPLKISREVALVPEESAFDTAGRWAIHAGDRAANQTEALLKIAYQGDIARIYAGGKLLTDNFYNGRTWVVGLDRIPAEQLREPLELVILPLRNHAPIYLPAGARPAPTPAGQIADVKNVDIVPQYHAVMDLAP